jgi:LuxR family maltose regulon positive regulatory protein
LLELVSQDDETRKRTMMGHIAGLKAHLAGWQRDYTLMMDLASQAISYLPRNHWICAYCAMMMGVAFWGSGNLQAAKGAFLEAAAVGQVSGNKRVAVTSAVYLGHALELEGHLEQAMELLQDSFQLAKQDGRELSVAGYLHVEVARILYELNEVDLAGQHLMDGIKLCQRLSDSRVEQLGHCLLARLHLARGDLAKAVHSIRNAERARVAPEAKVDMRGAEYPEVRLWLKQDKLGEVETWLDENDANLDHITHFKTKLTYTMHARALIALGRAHTGGTYLNGALDLLRELLGMAERNGWGGKVIEILALQALAFQAKRDILDAMAALARALALAEREGFVRVFVDEGPPMAHLLREAATRGVGPDYARRLLAAFPAAGAKEAGPSERQVLNSRFVEPLSDRELDVLELLAEGLTNREIASRLFLSLNTVKVHTRNIYGKLDAHSRTQAAARARALGILSSA